MTVVKFPSPPEKVAANWQPAELQQFLAVSADAIAAGEASGWEVGFTERNDPQVYLLGPPPDYECILSISRLGRLYVIEDGHGRVLFEHDNPMLLAEQATAALRRRKASLVARIVGVVRAPRGVRGEDGSHDGGADRTPDSRCPATCRAGLTGRNAGYRSIDDLVISHAGTAPAGQLCRSRRSSRPSTCGRHGLAPLDRQSGEWAPRH
jgi:hypothetical protein